MEESKELQGAYKIFRSVVYLSVLMEFAMYLAHPEWNSIVNDIFYRVKSMYIYRDGHMWASKLVTFMLVCITCMGTRNKKSLDMNWKHCILWPFLGGVMVLVVSVVLYASSPYEIAALGTYICIWLYVILSLGGTVAIHIALDNASKYFREGILKDRFNLENESFEQCTQKVENKYSVNIPMRFYYKGKFREGYINVVNPFRGTKKPIITNIRKTKMSDALS